MPGYPIRTPWDHSLVDSSPRPIAASHVLHRLLVPRHPPFALDNLTTKMLASTMQFSTNNQNPTHHTPPTPHPRQPPPTEANQKQGTVWRARQNLKHNPRETKPPTPPNRAERVRLVPSGPNRALTTGHPGNRHPFPHTPTPPPQGD